MVEQSWNAKKDAGVFRGSNIEFIVRIAWKAWVLAGVWGYGNSLQCRESWNWLDLGNVIPNLGWRPKCSTPEIPMYDKEYI